MRAEERCVREDKRTGAYVGRFRGCGGCGRKEEAEEKSIGEDCDQARVLECGG